MRVRERPSRWWKVLRELPMIWSSWVNSSRRIAGRGEALKTDRLLSRVISGIRSLPGYRRRAFHLQNVCKLYFTFCVIACIANALITIVTFFLYVRARLASSPREGRYQSIHFIPLALFVLFGVLILVHLSNKLNSGTIM